MALVATKKLKGYNRQCGRQTGGVSRVGAIKVDAATIEEAEGVITSVTFETGECFHDYQSELDQAEFTCANGETNVLVRLNRVGAEASNAVAILEENAPCGLLLLVQFNNGEAAIIGYTHEFKSSRPIVNVEYEFNSGKGLGDANYVDVTFKTSQVEPPMFLSDSVDIDTLFTPAS